MARNTKEISLIQIRQGNLSELPRALHQAEFGLGKDGNRLFIGNAENSILQNRTTFPYQNLEILTEMSDLSNYLKYVYENNIYTVDGVENRTEYKEIIPLVFHCSAEEPIINRMMSFKINNYTIFVNENATINDIIDAINSKSDVTHVYATKLQGTNFITFISFTSGVALEDVDGNFSEVIGFPTNVETPSSSLPTRLVGDKLNDIILMSDFGAVADGTTNVAKLFNKAICEVYKNGKDSQFFRRIDLQAGTYVFDKETSEHEITEGYFVQIEYPLPLISNLYLKGNGIDRTILKSQNYDSAFLNCYNDSLVLNGETNYTSTQTPTNIIIEDMTLNTQSIDLCKLASASNVTFNRVKFVGSSYSTLVNISGTVNKKSSNIVFNECIFDTAKNAIVVNSNTSNIHVKNCLFKNISSETIIIGDTTTDTVNYGTIHNCMFEACGQNLRSGSLIKCLTNTKYISVSDNKFEENVYNRVSISPYTSDSELNYCDAYDPNTSRGKYLRFNGTQPVWDYITEIRDEEGNIIDFSNVNGDISFETIGNDLHVTSLVSGDTILKTKASSDIVVGESSDANTEPSGNVIFKKDLKLNNKKIVSDDDVVIKPSSIIKIDTTDYQTKYEYLINNEKDAIPNVAFVKNNAKHSIMKPITYETLELMDGEVIPLVLFDSNVYGDDMHITRVSIDVTKPFYKLDKNNAIVYTKGLSFERGDLVSDNTNYYVVVKQHTVSENDTLEGNDKVVLVDIDNQPSVKYIDIIGYAKNGQVYNISNTYRPSFLNNGNRFICGVNIQDDDKHGLTGCLDFVNGTDYNNGSYIKYADRIYKVNYTDGSTVDTLNTEDIFNPDFCERVFSEGHNYIFDMEKELYNMTEQKVDTDDTLLNWADGKLYIRLLDENRVPLSNVSAAQFNPGGEIVVRIEMIKHDEIVRPELETYTCLISTTPDDATVKMTSNGVTATTKTMDVKFGSTVYYEVSKEGYETHEDSITIFKDESVYVELMPCMETLTINPTPSDATVTLSANGYEQSGNSITVAQNTEVLVSISKEGYESYNEVVIVDTTKTLDIELSRLQTTLTIIPTPSDATVVMTAEGYTQSGNSITVPYGTSVEYTVSKEGYETISGTENVISSKTLDIVLEEIPYDVELTEYIGTANDVEVPTTKTFDEQKSNYKYNLVEVSE